MNISPLAILLVGLGGAVGSSLRYTFSVLIQSQSASGFPWGTLVVNVIGCFVIGVLIGLSLSAPIKWTENLKLVFATGFCGGFTTFSAFSAETVALLDKGEVTLAITYIAASILFGLTSTFFGLLLMK